MVKLEEKESPDSKLSDFEWFGEVFKIIMFDMFVWFYQIFLIFELNSFVLIPVPNLLYLIYFYFPKNSTTTFHPNNKFYQLKPLHI